MGPAQPPLRGGPATAGGDATIPEAWQRPHPRSGNERLQRHAELPPVPLVGSAEPAPARLDRPLAARNRAWRPLTDRPPPWRADGEERLQVQVAGAVAAPAGRTQAIGIAGRRHTSLDPADPIAQLRVLGRRREDLCLRVPASGCKKSRIQPRPETSNLIVNASRRFPRGSKRHPRRASLAVGQRSWRATRSPARAATTVCRRTKPHRGMFASCLRPRPRTEALSSRARRESRQCGTVPGTPRGPVGHYF